MDRIGDEEIPNDVQLIMLLSSLLECVKCYWPKMALTQYSIFNSLKLFTRLQSNGLEQLNLGNG